MFCPDGYICVIEMCDRIRGAVYKGVSEGWLDIRKIAKQHNDEIVPENYPERLDYNSIAPHIYEELEEAAITMFIVNHDDEFYISSLQGHALKISSCMLEWSPTFYELPGGGEGSGFRNRRGRDYFNTDRWDGFYFIDLEQGVLDLKSHARAEARYRGGDDLVRRAKVMRDIDGWPLCWKMPDVELTNERLIDLTFGRGRAVPDQRRRRGPASERHLALEAYRQLYPNGHEGVDTWSEVVKRTGYSESTLRRAIEDS